MTPTRPAAHPAVERAAPTTGVATASRPHKLLFLLPFAPDLRGSHGGARATAAMIDMLSRYHRVCVLYLAAPGDPLPRELPGGCERLMAVPVEPRAPTDRPPAGRLRNAVGKLISSRPEWVEASWSALMASEAAAIATAYEPDIVHFEFHVMAQYIPFVRAACPRAACIVTEHEPGITADERGGTFLTVRQRLGAVARRRAWRRYERSALRRADAIVVFTVCDATALARLLGRDSPLITVIPFRLSSDALPPVSSAAPVKSDFLFVGNFRHPPNADAARRLVRSIFPLIQNARPDATLAIVGADPPEDLVAAASECVNVTGWVDDPMIYLAGAAVVLVPLRQGGGLRVKMLEACAAGKAIVASRMAVEGLSLTDGEDFMLAQSDEEFAEKGIALLANPKARSRLEAASRRWFEGEHDVGRWSSEYADFYATLTKGRDAEGRSRAR